MNSRSLSDFVRRGVMISNAWPATRMTRGATLAATASTLDRCPFFEVVQTVDIPFADERREFAAFTRRRSLAHTYMLTRALADAGLNLSALDSTLRERSCDFVVEKLEEAIEAGATGGGMTSGSPPADPTLRITALECLGESLVRIADAAAAFP